MVQQSKFVVISGGKAISGVVETMQAAGEVREATTGRVVNLPRVWAVAAPQAVRAERRGEEGQSGATAEMRKAQARVAPVEEVAFYRKYTEALLRRYVQLTMEAGRVSSLMGRDVLRGRASSYRIHGFDDAVIFRVDVEKCLRQMERQELEILRRIAIQEYTQAEAAEFMGLSLRTAGSRYVRALDRLTQILLRVRLLEPLKGCQVAMANPLS